MGFTRRTARELKVFAKGGFIGLSTERYFLERSPQKKGRP